MYINQIILFETSHCALHTKLHFFLRMDPFIRRKKKWKWFVKCHFYSDIEAEGTERTLSPFSFPFSLVLSFSLILSESAAKKHVKRREKGEGSMPFSLSLSSFYGSQLSFFFFHHMFDPLCCVLKKATHFGTRLCCFEGCWSLFLLIISVMETSGIRSLHELRPFIVKAGNFFQNFHVNWHLDDWHFTSLWPLINCPHLSSFPYSLSFVVWKNALLDSLVLKHETRVGQRAFSIPLVERLLLSLSLSSFVFRSLFSFCSPVPRDIS